MDESTGTRDLNSISKWLRIGGAIGIVAGIAFYATAPASVPMSDSQWFERESARHHAQFIGEMLGMFGLFFFLTGWGASARAQRIRLALQKQSAQAMSEGVAAGMGSDPKARLERLDSLRRDGTLTEDEYRRKRAEIVDAL